MFFRDGILLKSDIFDGLSVGHGFSSKQGGVSTHPYTASLNLAMGREDSDDCVRENIGIFVRAASYGRYGAENAVCAPQIHSSIVRRVGLHDCGDGVIRSSPVQCDGFVTDEPGVFVFVRVADCTPILLCGEKHDKSPVIAAVHAGWRGTVKGIAAEAVSAMAELGCIRESVRAAVGPHIGVCCFEVGGDLKSEAEKQQGKSFADRYVISKGKNSLGEEKYLCDMSGMNRELLVSAGVRAENIDISGDCTMCMSDIYYSHRKTAGKRGAMGAGIVIL